MSETTTASSNPPATPPPPLPKGNGQVAAKSKPPLFWWLTTIVLAVLVYFGLSYFIEAMTHETTDDAFIAGHVISIAPRVEGQVVAVHVLDNQMVHSNDLLVEIDPATFA